MNTENATKSPKMVQMGRFELVNATIKQGIKKNADGSSTNYVVAEFVPEGTDALMEDIVSNVTLQILARYGKKEEEQLEFLQRWVDRANEGGYITTIGQYEVDGFEPFVRFDREGGVIRNKDKAIIRYTSAIIRWFCDDEGNCKRNDTWIVNSAENLIKNSKRIMTVEAYKTQMARRKAAAEAAKSTVVPETPKDDLIDEADFGDDLG